MQPTQTQQRRALKPKEITGGMVVGFAIGLAIASMIAGFVSWVALNRHQQKLAGDFQLARAVIATKRIEPGQPVEAKALAERAMPSLVVTPNAVTPDDADDVIGKASTVRFEPGDVVLRSAFGLAPREPEKAE